MSCKRRNIASRGNHRSPHDEAPQKRTVSFYFFHRHTVAQRGRPSTAGKRGTEEGNKHLFTLSDALLPADETRPLHTYGERMRKIITVRLKHNAEPGTMAVYYYDFSFYNHNGSLMHYLCTAASLSLAHKRFKKYMAAAPCKIKCVTVSGPHIYYGA
jgi:hypothetical protein